MRVRRRKYEASIYYMRELPEPPPPDELPYYLERLHDIYIKMANVHDVFGYTKEFIRNPRTDDDGIWRGVLDEYWIPYKVIEWQPVKLMNPNEDKSKFDCISKPFLYKNGLSCTLKIEVWCPHKEILPQF